MVVALFWVGRDRWRWVGVCWGEWGWVHCLIMPLFNWLMSLTKDGDGLLRLLEMLLFFFSMWQKGKITSVQGILYQDSFLFCRKCIVYIIESIACLMNPMITVTTTYSLMTYSNFFYKLCRDKWWCIKKKTEMQ